MANAQDMKQLSMKELLNRIEKVEAEHSESNKKISKLEKILNNHEVKICVMALNSSNLTEHVKTLTNEGLEKKFLFLEARVEDYLSHIGWNEALHRRKSNQEETELVELKKGTKVFVNVNDQKVEGLVNGYVMNDKGKTIFIIETDRYGWIKRPRDGVLVAAKPKTEKILYAFYLPHWKTRRNIEDYLVNANPNLIFQKMKNYGVSEILIYQACGSTKDNQKQQSSKQQWTLEQIVNAIEKASPFATVEKVKSELEKIHQERRNR